MFAKPSGGRLVLRLGRDMQEPLQWLLYSDVEHEIIASGELSNALALSSLQSHADGAEVIVLVPSSDVLLCSVMLPPNAKRKVLNAIPFMLEEDICGDISQHFFALGQRMGDEQQVAVIAKEKLTLWKHALADAGIFCQTMVPDALALPNIEGTISLVQFGSQLIARFSSMQGIEGEIEWLLPFIKEKAGRESLSIECFSDIEGLQADELENLNFNYSELPLLMMLNNIDSHTLNLCQGAYSVKRAGNPHWQKWKLAAALAAVALTVNLVGKTVELNQLKSQRAEVNVHINQVILQGFPNIGPYRQARLAVQNEMTKLEQTGSGLSMLAILSQLTDAFVSSGVTPQTLRYDASRTELRMQSVANNFESLERFRRDIQALGFDVDQGAINNQGNQVVGVVIIRG